MFCLHTKSSYVAHTDLRLMASFGFSLQNVGIIGMLPCPAVFLLPTIVLIYFQILVLWSLWVRWSLSIGSGGLNAR